ncbi:MAG: ribosome small subunit-dependent GTPase A [Anaerolineae bacterium]|nr:ribosome small subunit-dependent GTPase A [Anaerolineae bacterium]
MSQKLTEHQLKSHAKGMEQRERQQRLKTAKKKMRRNQAPKKARRKDWMPGEVALGEDWDEVENWGDDYEDYERIMPRDEGERRRAIESIAFRQADSLVSDDNEIVEVSDPETAIGLVIEVSKGLFRVQIGSRAALCSLRGSLNVEETGYTNAAAVGDQVVVREDGAGGGVIDSVLPRRSLLARPDVYDSHLQQVIVANVDQLLVVSAWREPHIWLELVDRYLVVALRNHLPAVICVNKIDLLEDAAELDKVMHPYRQLGYPIVITSTRTGAGLERLRGLMIGQTTVLSGLSGVGKSSLISAVEPGLNLRVSDVSDYRHDGRHTTTQATWLPLAAGGAVVDTPGIREFGLSGLYKADLIDFMPDLAEHTSGCRFNNCLHVDEPDCAVHAAVESGQAAASRYDSYKQILTTLPA